MVLKLLLGYSDLYLNLELIGYSFKPFQKLKCQEFRMIQIKFTLYILHDFALVSCEIKSIWLIMKNYKNIDLVAIIERWFFTYVDNNRPEYFLNTFMGKYVSLAVIDYMLRGGGKVTTDRVGQKWVYSYSVENNTLINK